MDAVWIAFWSFLSLCAIGMTVSSVVAQKASLQKWQAYYQRKMEFADPPHAESSNVADDEDEDGDQP